MPDMNKKIAFSTVALGISRIIGMFVTYITVPIALNYLGPEQYGLWLAATSFLVIIASYNDGGISNALVTETARLTSVGTSSEIRKVIASAHMAVLVLAGGFVILVSLIAPWMPWAWVFGVDASAHDNQIGTLVLIIAIWMAFSLFTNIVPKVRWGMQQTLPVVIWECLSSLVVLPAAFLIIHYDLGFRWFVAAVIFTPLVIRVLGTLQFFLTHSTLIPRLQDIELQRSRLLLGGGSMFLAIAFSHAIAVQSDQILIANLIGAEHVPAYSILNRLFGVPFILCNFLFMSTWPVYSRMATKGDFENILIHFRRIFAIVALGSIVASILLGLFLDQILGVWLGHGLSIPPYLKAGMMVYAPAVVMSQCCTMLFTSLDRRREQIFMSLAMTVLNLGLSLILIPRIGSAGAIIGTVVSYFFCIVIPSLIIMSNPKFVIERVRT
jgi:O-antigen/teichoic acid export membrane protein